MQSKEVIKRNYPKLKEYIPLSNETYIKLLKPNMLQYNFKYILGDNYDSDYFNPAIGVEGGLTFCDSYNMPHFLDYGEDVYECTPLGVTVEKRALCGREKYDLSSFKSQGLRLDHYIGKWYEVRVIKYLMRHGLDVHIRNEKLFRYAIQYGYKDLYKFLIEKCGVNIGVQNEFAIFYAYRTDNTELVNYLISRGSSVKTREDLINYLLRYDKRNNR